MEKITNRDLVCNQKLALKLRDLGVQQTSLFYYHTEEPDIVVFSAFELTSTPAVLKISAFTVTELGIMLPDYCATKKNSNSGVDKMFVGEFIEGHVNLPMELEEFVGFTTNSFADTEADARAKLLITILEQGIKIESTWKVNAE